MQLGRHLADRVSFRNVKIQNVSKRVACRVPHSRDKHIHATARSVEWLYCDSYATVQLDVSVLTVSVSEQHRQCFFTNNCAESRCTERVNDDVDSADVNIRGIPFYHNVRVE